MIVLDLEFNSGMYGQSRLEEVLQIGAVRIPGPGGAITGTFNVYIRPRVHKRMSPGARVLPELAMSESAGVGFPEGYARFIDWCGGETEFAEWGRDDFRVLGRNAIYYGFEPMLPKRVYDIQSAFSRTLGEVNGLQLYSAAEYCRIPDSFVFHNALNDAMYTSLITGFVSAGALEASVCPVTEESIRPAAAQKPRDRQNRMGPFEDLERTLNNMGCRRAVCPKCRGVSRVREWYTLDGTSYWGLGICPEHGRIIRSLRLDSRTPGQLWARCETCPPTPEYLRALDQARANGETWQCVIPRPPTPPAGQGKKRRRRRKRKK